MKKELLLFISSNYDKNRINNELFENKYNLFDEIKVLNENDLDDYIKPIINNIINTYGIKGYGYWIWKPYLILKELEKLNEGDILVHLDAHCHTNKLKDNFDEIINYLNNTDKPIIFPSVGANDYIFTTTKLKEKIENVLNYKFTEEEMLSSQYEAGIVFMKKCDFVVNFYKQYLNIMLDDISLITDIYNNDPNNHKTFIDNRHDQSVCSLLCKYYHINDFGLGWHDFNYLWNFNLKIPFDKVYVISYVKNLDKQLNIKNFLNRCNIKFEYIYGPDTNSYKYIFNFNNIEIMTETYNEEWYNIGHISGTIAHLTAVQHALTHNYNSCLIIEDDAIFTPDFNYIQKCFNNIPDDADCCRFGLTWRDMEYVNNTQEKFWIKNENCLGTQCYSLNNQQAMQYYLDQLKIQFTTCDRPHLFYGNSYALRDLICKDPNSPLEIKL